MLINRLDKACFAEFFYIFRSFAMKLKSLAMAMSAEDHYLRGKELICIDSDTAYEHLEIACDKKYVKACVYGYETGMNKSLCGVPLYNPYHRISKDRVLKLADKACKLGKKEYCGLRQKIKEANEKKAAEERERKKAEERSRKALPIAERRLCEEMPEACPRRGEMDTIQGTPKVGEMKRLLRELHQEAIQELEDEEKFGKEEATKRREASKAKRQERRWCKAHPKECRRKQAEKAVKESTHTSPFGLGDHSESWSQRELKQSGNTCDKGEASACTSMARIYLDGGENVPRNIHKAVELFLKGCQSGDPWACQELGAIHEAGRYGKKADAPRFYQAACMVNTKTKNEFFSAKHGKSCQKLLK